MSVAEFVYDDKFERIILKGLPWNEHVVRVMVRAYEGNFPVGWGLKSTEEGLVTDTDVVTEYPYYLTAQTNHWGKLGNEYYYVDDKLSRPLHFDEATLGSEEQRARRSRWIMEQKAAVEERIQRMTRYFMLDPEKIKVTHSSAQSEIKLKIEIKPNSYYTQLHHELQSAVWKSINLLCESDPRFRGVFRIADIEFPQTE